MRILGGVGIAALAAGGGALFAAPVLAADAQGFLVKTAEAQASVEVSSTALVIVALAATFIAGAMAVLRPSKALVPVRVKARGRR